ncbi:hypothetical protein J7K42_01965 [bacterium]|nr:hypothetical protein [bacterium]
MKSKFKKIAVKLKIIFVPCEENSYRPKFLESKFLFYYLLVVVLLKFVFISFLFYFPNTPFFAEISRITLIELTNQQRKDLGLNPLRENPLLNKAAQLKAQDMLNKGYFSHQSPDGTTPWYWFRKANYNYQVAGENLGIGFLDSEEIYRAWDNSPSHRANLLNPKYQDIGIAILKGNFKGNEATVVVQLFGSPQQSLVEPKKKRVEGVVETAPVSAPETEPEQKSEQRQKQGDIQEEVKGETSTFFNFLKFMTKKYNNLLHKIISYSLIFIVSALFLNVFVRFDIQHKDLILKTVLIGAILVLFIFISKDFVIQFIPHNLGIY